MQRIGKGGFLFGLGASWMSIAGVTTGMNREFGGER
jgi:hypothetical protein